MPALSTIRPEIKEILGAKFITRYDARRLENEEIRIEYHEPESDQRTADIKTLTDALRYYRSNQPHLFR